MRNLFDAYFKNIGFKKKLLIAFLFIYSLPILFLTGWLSYNFYFQLLDSTLKDNENAGNAFASRISERVTTMKDTLSAVSSDKRIIDILKHMDNLDDYSLSDQIRDKDEFVRYLNTLVDINKLHKISFFMPDQYYFTYVNNVFFQLSTVTQTSWYSEYAKNKGNVYLSYNSNSIDYSSNGILWTEEVPVISLIRPLYNPNNLREIIALGVAEISHTEIKSMMNELNTQCTIYIMEDKNIYIVGGSDVLKKASLSDLNVKESWEKLNIRNQGIFYITCMNIKGTSLKLLMVVPVRDVLQVIIRQVIMVIIIILLSSVVIVLLAIYFSNGISRRLEVLLKRVNKIREGDLYIDKVDMGLDEIGVLNKNIDYMVESIKKLLDEQNRLGQQMKITEVRAAKAELLALQSQINPHFLYNTLDLISWQSRFNNVTGMASLIKALSRFYKLSLSKGSDLVDLDMELEHVKSFVTIQNYRYNNSISLEIDVPETVNCKLPKITLQPFVENAIIHGILCRPDLTGWIHITAENVDDFVDIAIIDNGIGMSTEKLEELNSRIQDNNGGIGICNVYERLKLYFGDAVSLRFESTTGFGTKVLLRVIKCV